MPTRASTIAHSYFGAADFPSNMPSLWDKRFAYLAKTNTAPVVIGEMGGFYTHATEADPSAKDQHWQDWAIKYMADNGIGVFYFALNPGSVDTGGLLQSDWVTPEAEKLTLLSQLPTTDVLAARQRSYMSHPPPPPSPTHPPAPHHPPRPKHKAASPPPPLTSPPPTPPSPSPPPPSPMPPPPPNPPPPPPPPKPLPPPPSPSHPPATPPPYSLSFASMAQTFLAVSMFLGVGIGVSVGVSLERAKKARLGRRGEVLPADEDSADRVPEKVPRAVQGAIIVSSGQGQMVVPAARPPIRVYDVD